MKFTARRIKRDLEINHPEVLCHFLVASKDKNYQFWKRNALCVDLYSNKVIVEKLNYIHRSPVKAGLMMENTNTGADYRFSSAGFYMGLGDEFGVLTDFRV